MKKMKVLNLYAGIGGNRRDWDNVDVTAVEKNERIAAAYANFFKNDTVIVGDAHKFLINHYKEYDFVWTSPPCPSHSRTNYFLNSQGKIRYPDMQLYEEIIFLQHFFTGKFCVENVISYYEPLIKPVEIGRHYLWTNFPVSKIKIESNIGRMNGRVSDMGISTTNLRKDRLKSMALFDFDIAGCDLTSNEKYQALKNCAHPDLGNHVLNCARGIILNNSLTQIGLFADHQAESFNAAQATNPKIT